MEKLKELTEQQTAVYKGILQYQKKYGYAPSIRELCEMCGLSSTSSVYLHLRNWRRRAISKEGKNRHVRSKLYRRSG